MKIQGYQLVWGVPWKIPEAWKNRFLILALVLMCQYLIQYNAIHHIKELYSYYSPHNIGIADVLLSSIWCLIPAVFLPLESTAPSSSGWVYYGFIYLSASAIGVTTLDSAESYCGYMAYLLLGMAVMYYVGSLGRISFPLKIHIKGLRFGIYMLSLVLALYAWWLCDFTISFGIDNAYVRRMEARKEVGFSGYVLALLRLLLPLIAVYMVIVRRSTALLIIVTFASLAIFSYDGTKSSILYPLLFALFAIGLKHKKLPIYILLTILITNVLAIIENIVTGRVLILDYIIRRAFVMPGWLSSIYWTYKLSSQDLANLSYEVGDYIFGLNQLDACNANTNFMMWGWVWAKWLGGLLIAASAGAVILIFNNVSRSKFPILGSLMACGTMLIWAEQFFHTSLLSSGVIWTLVLALVMLMMPLSSGNSSVKYCTYLTSKGRSRKK